MELSGSGFTLFEIRDFAPVIYWVMQNDNSFAEEEILDVTSSIARVLPEEPSPDEYGRGIEAREEYEKRRSERKGIESSYVSVEVLAKLMFSALPFPSKESVDRLKLLCSAHWKEDKRALQFLDYIAR